MQKSLKERSKLVTKRLILWLWDYNRYFTQFLRDNKSPSLSMNKNLDEFLFNDSTLWELDWYSCTDKWIHHRSIQNAFKYMYEIIRVKEKVIIFLTQSQYHINWYIIEIRNVTKTLEILKIENCELNHHLLNHI